MKKLLLILLCLPMIMIAQTSHSEQIQDLRIRVLNIIGEELVSDNLEQFIGEYTKQVDLTNNSKGIYFLEVETNEGVVNKKLILQ